MTKKYKKIAFVCEGNTCRSAMAQFVMRSKLKEKGETGYKIFSFGLRVGKGSINENASAALKAAGYRLAKFVPKPFDGRSAALFDALITMTYEQKNYLKGYDNVYCVDELCKTGEIADPYGRDEAFYKKTLFKIEDCCDIIIKLLEELK